MKVTFYMNCVSAHQLPLAKEVAERVGPENFCYVDAGEKSESAQQGEVQGLRFKVQRVEKSVGEAPTGRGDGAREWLETADVMLTGMRDLALFERRARKGLRTYYTSERWFKPIQIVRLFGLFDCSMGGWVRMLVPGYRRMVKRFVTWANGDDGARVLAIGPWAKRDFLRMGVKAEKIVEWGYFVEPGTGARRPVYEGVRAEGAGARRPGYEGARILWGGRMLDLKRVDTIVRAVSTVSRVSAVSEVSAVSGVSTVEGVSGVVGGGIELTLVGDGPEKERLMALARRLGLSVKIEQSNNRTTEQSNNRTIPSVRFLPSQPMAKMRELMREHDLYVFASNGYEGWGAVVSEALEEGMDVIGTFEAGASATLLPKERLFHCGDWRTLAALIVKEMKGELPPCGIGEWTAKFGAKRLLEV